VAVTPTTFGTSTGTTAHAFVMSRSTAASGGKSGLIVSVSGCDRSVLSLPWEATTRTPLDWAYPIARRSAFQIARCSASLRQLNSHGSAK
jgi:hypothetical protein